MLENPSHLEKRFILDKSHLFSFLMFFLLSPYIISVNDTGSSPKFGPPSNIKGCYLNYINHQHNNINQVYLKI